MTRLSALFNSPDAAMSKVFPRFLLKWLAPESRGCDTKKHGVGRWKPGNVLLFRHLTNVSFHCLISLNVLWAIFHLIYITAPGVQRVA